VNQVELVLGFLRPRQVGHPLDVGANQVAVGGVLRKCGQDASKISPIQAACADVGSVPLKCFCLFAQFNMV
jgi:hypothetical protein